MNEQMMKRSKAKAFVGIALGSAAVVWGCSGGGGSDDGGTDAGTDSGNPGNDSAAPDTGGKDATPGNDGGSDAAQPVNGCTTFTDYTADGGTITFPTGAAPAQYSPNCVQIKTHESITWTGSFSSHPLIPKGGDTPTPIVATSTGTTVTFTFDNAGTFGFGCGIHASMAGAVLVTP